MIEEKLTLAGEKKPRFFYGYIVVLAAFSIWLVAWGTFHTFGVFFKPLLAEFGWTRAMTAGARSLTSGILGLLGIVTGGLTDRFGPRRVLLIFGSFVGLGYLLMSQISSVWQYYMVYGVVVGIGLSAVAVPIMSTIARWFLKRRGLMTGIMQAGAGLGGMSLSPLAAWLILTYNWRFAFTVLGITALALFIIAGMFFRRDPGEIGQLPYGAEGQEVKNEGQDLSPGGFSLKRAIRTKQFWMLWFMFFGFGFSRTTILVHIAVHVTDLGFPLTAGAYVLAIVSGAGIVSGVGMGRLADVVGNRRAFMLGYIVIIASMLWLLVADKLWMLYLFAAAFGFSWSGLAVIRALITAEVFGLGSLGAILGTIELGAELGAISGPFLAGWLFDTTKSYLAAFLTITGVAIIGLMLTWRLRPLSNKERGFQ